MRVKKGVDEDTGCQVEGEPCFPFHPALAESTSSQDTEEALPAEEASPEQPTKDYLCDPQAMPAVRRNPPRRRERPLCYRRLTGLRSLCAHCGEEPGVATTWHEA